MNWIIRWPDNTSGTTLCQIVAEFLGNVDEEGGEHYVGEQGDKVGQFTVTEQSDLFRKELENKILKCNTNLIWKQYICRFIKLVGKNADETSTKLKEKKCFWTLM